MNKHSGAVGAGADASKWLEAFSDPLSQTYTFSSCITLSDLNNDGDHKLVIGDLGTGKLVSLVDGYNMRLKVYKGVTMFKENALIDLPTAVVAFFLEPGSAAIAVAAGCAVFIYKNLKPYYRFNIPNMEISEAEFEIWNQVRNEQLDLTSLTEFLEGLKSQVPFSALTPRSQKFLTLKHPDEKREFVNTQAREDLKKPTTVTCLQTMKKSSQNKDAIHCLVMGCENGKVYIVDGEAFTVLAQVDCPSAPVFLHTSGLYDVEYRILVCCRNSCVYTIKRETTSLTKPTIELNSHAVGMVKVSKNIIIGCMDQTLRAFSLKGRKQWSLKMPAGITTIGSMEYTPKNYNACLVALENCELHIYQDIFLVDLLKFDDVVTGLKFGQFGREEGALVLTLRGGGLNVKVFKRTAKLEEKSNAPGPPAAQAQKLNIPKKTKIFVDQTIREREEGQKIHQVFQRDLFMLRLSVAKDYVRMLDAKLNPISVESTATSSSKTSNSGETMDQVKLSAQIQGFGPVFLMKMVLEATGADAVCDIHITFSFNPRLYAIANPIIPIGMVVPGTDYQVSTSVTCLSPDKGLADDIKVFVVKERKVEPILTAVISMPVSEISLLE